MSGNYEQSKTEKGSGNRNTSSRKRIYERILIRMESINSDKNSAKRLLEGIEVKGHGKYINIASDDRVAGIPSQENETKYQDDPKSYHYGYITKGGRRLEAVVYALEKEGKYEEIAAIGQRDYSLGLTEEEIGITKEGKLEGLAKYPSYLEGYNSTKKRKGSR